MAEIHNPGAVAEDTAVLAENSLLGKTALITGGSRGIGFAAAKQMGELGAKIILVAQDPSRLEKALEELEKNSLVSQGYAVDLA